MYCKFCGNEVDSDAVFCPACGKRQDADGNLHAQRQESKEHPVKSGGGIQSISGRKLAFLLPPILIILTVFMPWLQYEYFTLQRYNLFELFDLMTTVKGSIYSIAVIAIILGLVCLAVQLISVGSVLTDSDKASRRATQAGIITAIFTCFMLIIVLTEVSDSGNAWYYPDASFGYGGFIALVLSVIQIGIGVTDRISSEAIQISAERDDLAVLTLGCSSTDPKNRSCVRSYDIPQTDDNNYFQIIVYDELSAEHNRIKVHFESKLLQEDFFASERKIYSWDNLEYIDFYGYFAEDSVFVICRVEIYYFKA